MILEPTGEGQFLERLHLLELILGGVYGSHRSIDPAEVALRLPEECLAEVEEGEVARGSSRQPPSKASQQRSCEHVERNILIQAMRGLALMVRSTPFPSVPCRKPKPKLKEETIF